MGGSSLLAERLGHFPDRRIGQRAARFIYKHVEVEWSVDEQWLSREPEASERRTERIAGACGSFATAHPPDPSSTLA